MSFIPEFKIGSEIQTDYKVNLEFIAPEDSVLRGDTVFRTLFFRYITALKNYKIELTSEGLTVSRVDKSEKILTSVRFRWHAGEKYLLSADINGSLFDIWLNGNLVCFVKDDVIKRGFVASASGEGIKVEFNESQQLTYKILFSERKILERIASLQYPQPRLWKKELIKDSDTPLFCKGSKEYVCTLKSLVGNEKSEECRVCYDDNLKIITLTDSNCAELWCREVRFEYNLMQCLNWDGEKGSVIFFNARDGAYDLKGYNVFNLPRDGHPQMFSAVCDLNNDGMDEIAVWDLKWLYIYTCEKIT